MRAPMRWVRAIQAPGLAARCRALGCGLLVLWLAAAAQGAQDHGAPERLG